MPRPCSSTFLAIFWQSVCPWAYKPITHISAFLTCCSPCVYSSVSSCLLMMHVHAQTQPTLCDPMDCSLPGSSVHGTFQARILEWVAISASRGSSWPRDWTCFSWVFCIGRQVLCHCGSWEVPPPSDKDSSSTGWGVHPPAVWLHDNKLHQHWPYFQTRSCLKGSG